jgi:hypothetical protein
VTTWHGWTVDRGYGLRIEAAVLRDINRMCGDAKFVETGGILIGRYSPQRTVAIVTEATPPPKDSHQARFWFTRGIAGLREMLAQRWRANDRTYYLGEWHFHPIVTIVPSADDFSQMFQIAHADNYRCKEPLLVIFGADDGHGARSLRAFVCPIGSLPTELLPTPAASPSQPLM